MNLLNRPKAFILLFSILLCSAVNAHSQIKICLTGRIVENLKSYGQSFLNAANLAKDQSDPTNKVKIKSYFYKPTPRANTYI